MKQGIHIYPCKLALIGVPPDASFSVRMIESGDFSTYTLKHTLADYRDIIGQSNSDGTSFKHKSDSNYATDRFYPYNLAKIGTAGWIRENRVLPIQLNPVQYNPVEWNC